MMFDNFHSVVSGLRSQMYEFLGYYSYIFKKIPYICPLSFFVRLCQNEIFIASVIQSVAKDLGNIL